MSRFPKHINFEVVTLPCCKCVQKRDFVVLFKFNNKRNIRVNGSIACFGRLFGQE